MLASPIKRRNASFIIIIIIIIINSETGSSPLKGREGNCGPGGK